MFVVWALLAECVFLRLREPHILTNASPARTRCKRARRLARSIGPEPRRCGATPICESHFQRAPPHSAFRG